MRVRLFTFCLLLLCTTQACALDFPLSEEAIRDAYYLGIKQGSLGDRFLSEYKHSIPGLKVGGFISEATVETPYEQVAVYASRALGYNAQQAVKEYFGKPMVVRLHLNVCYMVDAPPDSIEIKVMQNKKEIPWSSETRDSYFPRSDKYTRPPRIGERVDLEFSPERMDSSDLTIVIDTPDGQHAETVFDLRTLR